MPRVKTFDQDQVLQKAMELFWKKGYHATSMQDLVDYLEINRASLYDTFGGKKDLFIQALKLYQKSSFRTILNLLEQQPDIREGLRRLLSAAVDSAVSDSDQKGCMVVNTSTELLPTDVDLLPLITSNKENFERALCEYLSVAQQRGQLAPGKNPKALAGLIFTFYNGLKVVTKVNADQKMLLQQVEVLLSTLDA